MTTAQVQQILSTIYSQINGNPGTINSVKIYSAGATVDIDWEAFSNAFSGQTITQQGSRVYKQVGSITYTSVNPSETEFQLP